MTKQDWLQQRKTKQLTIDMIHFGLHLNPTVTPMSKDELARILNLMKNLNTQGFYYTVLGEVAQQLDLHFNIQTLVDLKGAEIWVES